MNLIKLFPFFLALSGLLGSSWAQNSRQELCDDLCLRRAVPWRVCYMTFALGECGERTNTVKACSQCSYGFMRNKTNGQNCHTFGEVSAPVPARGVGPGYGKEDYYVISCAPESGLSATVKWKSPQPTQFAVGVYSQGLKVDEGEFAYDSGRAVRKFRAETPEEEVENCLLVSVDNCVNDGIAI